MSVRLLLIIIQTDWLAESESSEFTHSNNNQYINWIEQTNNQNQWKNDNDVWMSPWCAAPAVPVPPWSNCSVNRGNWHHQLSLVGIRSFSVISVSEAAPSIMSFPETWKAQTLPEFASMRVTLFSPGFTGSRWRWSGDLNESKSNAPLVLRCSWCDTACNWRYDANLVNLFSCGPETLTWHGMQRSLWMKLLFKFYYII